MPSTATLVTAPSAFGPTGGTNVVFTSQGGATNGKDHLIVAADTDFRLRRSIDFSVKEPSPSTTAPNGYTQCRQQGYLKIPLLLDNGKITVNTVSIQVAYDPETNPTEVAMLLDLAAQMLTDSETRSIFANNSL